ncbi:MAG: prephenate dehydrogenase/arogenate dehydrogenase family protein [Candidatus Omnitrophica bacterium]|nr:prephenate dehydrogenase/arogenate dehydrogenase family protein [Candidatus Omnitrophota bacterium]
MQFKKITIIGVGLIGGSIGLNIKKRHPRTEIVGVTAHSKTLRAALRCGAVDRGTLDAKESVVGADLIIIATPVDRILKTLRKIMPKVKRGCVITDVGSVKGSIVGDAERLAGNKASFIGSHPMAGSEKRGIDEAKSGLFKGTPCIVTKTSRSDREALKKVRDFWKDLGSDTYVLSPEEHDEHISKVSHLVHIAAATLCLTTDTSSLKFASSGFRDTTRIASSDSKLWIPIVLSNRLNVIKDINRYIAELGQIRSIIASNDGTRLRKKLLKAKAIRDNFEVT